MLLSSSTEDVEKFEGKLGMCQLVKVKALGTKSSLTIAGIVHMIVSRFCLCNLDFTDAHIGKILHKRIVDAKGALMQAHAKPFQICFFAIFLSRQGQRCINEVKEIKKKVAANCICSPFHTKSENETS